MSNQDYSLNNVELKVTQLWGGTLLGCFNPNLDQIWTNPNVGLKM